MLAVVALFGAAALLMRGRSAPSVRLEPKPEPGESAPDVAKMLEELVADKPTPGFFYQIQPEDTPLSVALEALGSEATVEDAVDYLRCMSSGPRYNLPMYATPSTSKAYPAAYMVPGKSLGIRVAFLPRNQDALDLMLRSKRPRMSVDPATGAPRSNDRAFGLVWMPPVDERFSCSAFSWEDGSSTIDPPPDLLEMLS